MADVFVTGATGFLGRPLVAALLRRGHAVTALCRPGSEARVPAGCRVVTGDALDGSSYAPAVGRGGVFVHLAGVAHPSPAKAARFREVDLRSVQVAAQVAAGREAAHFVYVSVARPAPVMQAYQQARAEGEAAILASGLAATFLRPWYVLGPGRRWPLLLLPLYALARLLPRARSTARRLGLLRAAQMRAALVHAVETGGSGITVLEVPAIRALPSDDSAR